MHKHTHTAEMHIDRISHSVHKTDTGATTHIHTLGVYTLGACLLQTIFVMINSFHKPYAFPSPTEIRAVMATEENSGCSMRAGLLGQAAPEQRIEMQQKSGLKELVMSVCPITTLKPTKDIKIMNKTSSLHCT